MPPKKNAIRMDLSSFLEDETFNESWTADEVDLNNITIPIQNVAATATISLDDFSKSTARGNRSGGKFLDPALRKEREEYPVPDYPPYKAVINNIPWDITEEGIQEWVEDGLEKQGAVLELVAPRNMDTERLKGIAFVTFNERADLEKALTFSGSKLNDRTVYVSVAAPRSNYGGRSNFDDMDWSGARGSNFRGGREDVAEPDWGSARGSNFRAGREDVAEPDWGSARGSNFRGSREPREDVPEPDWGSARGSNFRAGREPREDVPEPDWSSARGSHFREGKEPRETGPEPDWSSARGSHFREPREPKEDVPEPDWSSARGSNFKESKPRGPEPDWSSARGSHFKEPRERASGPDIDWSSARGAKFGRQQQPASALPKKTYARKEEVSQKKTEEAPKVVKSAYSVLSTEDEDEDDEEEVKKNTVQHDDVERLEKATSNLKIEQNDNEEWETVGKK